MKCIRVPNSISVVSAVSLFLLQFELILYSDSTALKSTINKHDKLVVISFDGFRSDYMSKTETPFLDSLVKSGVSVPYMKSQFSTKTFPNHQSLSTGLFTENHGIVDNSNIFDPLYNKTLTGFGEYNDEFWNFDPDVVPIWILNEWAGDGRISGVQFPGCNQHYGRNRSLPTHFLVYNGSLPYETRMDIVHQWLTNETHPANLVFMYFEEPDTAGHNFGPESEEVKTQIRRLDGITAYLINKLKASGIYEDVNIIFWSDHGMQEVNVGNRVNLTEIMPNLDRNSYTRYGRSPVLNILPKEGKETEVYQAFKLASLNNNFSVYRREEVPDRLHFQNNRRIMPIVVIADPGYVFDDWKSNTSDPTLKFGVHGYDNEAETMRPFFIANGPAFKNGFTVEPFDNVDLFPLIASMMKFGHSPSNGTLTKVSRMLLETSGSKSDIRVSPFYSLVTICFTAILNSKSL